MQKIPVTFSGPRRCLSYLLNVYPMRPYLAMDGLSGFLSSGFSSLLLHILGTPFKININYLNVCFGYYENM